MPCFRRTEKTHLSHCNGPVLLHITAMIYPARHSPAHSLRNGWRYETSITPQDTKNAAHYPYPAVCCVSPSVPEPKPAIVFFISIRVTVGLCHGRRPTVSWDTVPLFPEVIAV